ncbi:MAG: biotin attachment protein [Desulfovibrionaceae bacterium]|nr:biotin attachment protein [Desulfovibrionaceae bacterium]
MLDISKLLEEIKQTPFDEVEIISPWCGRVSCADINEDDPVSGPCGSWLEIPGTLLASVEREHNPKPVRAPEKGRIKLIRKELEGQFIEAGTPLVTLKHFLTKQEVIQIILRQALHLFNAPERAKYYFVPEVDMKIRTAGHRSVRVNDGMDLFIMSRMKREVTLPYSGPEGLIYSVYFSHNENVGAGDPLIGVCPEELMPIVEDVVARVQAEWEEQD